jgi:galactokinase
MIDVSKYGALCADFERRFASAATVVARAPGRVNLIGDHTDYCEGYALPMAIDLEIVCLAAPALHGEWRVFSKTQNAEFSEPTDKALCSRGDWGDYIRGVIAGFHERGITVPSADILIGGDLPPGAGLSSSAALESAISLVLEHLSNTELTPAERVDLCQRAEHSFAGMPCGAMDQYAVINGQAAHAMLLDCRRLSADQVRLPAEPLIAVIDSGVRHELVEGGYAQRHTEARTAEAQLSQSLRDATCAQLQTLTDPLLAKRARHIVTENQRVLDFVEALNRGDSDWAGRLLSESHASLRDDYAVSCSEVDALVEACVDAGAVGARMTGGGFGGSVIALVAGELQTTFSDALAAYRALHPATGPIRWLHAAPGGERAQLTGARDHD